MPGIFIQITRIFLPILTALFTFFCFYGTFRHKSKRTRIYTSRYQLFVIYAVLSLAFLSMFSETEEMVYLWVYLGTLALVTAISLVFRLIYRNASAMLTNVVCFLLSIGLIMQTRIQSDKAVKSLLIAAAALLVTAFFPYILNKDRAVFRKLKWTYFAVGILLLAVVLVAGQTSFGARLSVSVFGISLQPSEFVKLLYVFFLAAMYQTAGSKKQILIASLCAAGTVLLLVGSRDLGGALIFFVIYVVMTYCAFSAWQIPLISAVFLILAFPVAGRVFSHVAVRIAAWMDPLSVIDDAGYQVSQSLFAIGTGSWLGSGLTRGRPDIIPVVVQDFIFSAVVEEMGVFVGICLILICFCCLFLFLNLALEMKDRFYRYVAIGLGTAYGVQVFLTIGGCIKLIPSTGVTLPFVSYGGSSLLASFMSFAILQGLYVWSKKKGGFR